MSNRRVLLIAFDACDKDLLGQWAAEGLLPNIQRLQSTAAYGITRSPDGLFVGAVWPSFWTSQSPDVHGRYCYEQINPGTYDDVRILPTFIKSAPWWKQLGDSGKRVAIIDVPKTYPTEGLNGVHICDWGTHDPDNAATVSWPPDEAAKLDARFGVDAVRNCNPYAESPAKLAELTAHLIERIQRKTEIVLHFLEREKWDCLVATFSDSHCVGHQCWHLVDPTDINYSKEAAAIAGNPMRDVYIALDDALGRIMDAAGDEYDVMTLASHGFRSHYDATFMLDEILKRMEKPKAVKRAKTTSFAKKAWMTLPAGVRSMLKPVKTRARVSLGVGERSARRYFAVPNNDAVGAIRFNLIGREPEGRVKPSEVDALSATIREDMLAFRNVETGAKLVHDVVRVDDIYDGPMRQHLPDLFVYWNHDTPVNLIESPKTGRIADKYKRGRTGDHTPLGKFFYQAPDVRPGLVPDMVSIMDIGPTIAERIGVELQNVDGKSFAKSMFNEGRADGVR